jgi:protocatechuate 3,4-dioxygenase beta subunit
VYIGPGTVQGTVFSAPGVPVPAGRQVRLLRNGGFTPTTVVTTATGQFAFTNVLPGTFALYTVDPSNSVETRVSNLVVPEGQTVTQDLTYLQLGVSGVVARANVSGPPAPLSGVQVVLRPLPTGTQRTTTSLSDGTYRFVGVNPGNYRVSATDPVSGATAQADIVVVADVPTAQDITFPVTGSIEVTVLVEGTTTPVPGAAVSSCFGTSCVPRSRGITDAAGRLTIQTQQIGTNRVRVSHPEASGNLNEDTVVIPDATTPGTLTLALAPTGTLTVTVLEPGGAPVSGAWVEIESTSLEGGRDTTSGSTTRAE